MLHSACCHIAQKSIFSVLFLFYYPVCWHIKLDSLPTGSGSWSGKRLEKYIMSCSICPPPVLIQPMTFFFFLQKQIIVDPLSFSEERFRPSLEERLESIISGAALMADSSCTRDDRRERIVAECNSVRQALQDLLSEYMGNVSVSTISAFSCCHTCLCNFSYHTTAQNFLHGIHFEIESSWKIFKH